MPDRETTISQAQNALEGLKRLSSITPMLIDRVYHTMEVQADVEALGAQTY